MSTSSELYSDLPFALGVRFKDQSQSILIGPNLLADRQLLGSYIDGTQVLIVSNTTIAPLYLTTLQSAFLDKQCDVLLLPDGENYKTQQSLLAIYEKLINKRHHRDTTIIALGGGHWRYRGFCGSDISTWGFLFTNPNNFVGTSGRCDWWESGYQSSTGKKCGW